MAIPFIVPNYGMRLARWKYMGMHELRTPGDEFSAVVYASLRDATAVGRERTWQELKGRITALRRELHRASLSMIGTSWWADRIQELEQCQKRLGLLDPPCSLRPPE